MHIAANLDALFPVLMVVVIIGIFAAVFVAAIQQQKRALQNLQQLASSLGLQLLAPVKKFSFVTTPARLTGRFRERDISIYSYTTGSGKQKQSWCALALTTRNAGQLSLRLSPENVFTRIGHALGLKDTRVGDPAFDDRFVVKTNDPSYVRAALIPEIRAQLLEVWTKTAAPGSIEVAGFETKYVERGSFASARLCARFPAMADAACSIADIAETYRG